MKKIAACAIWAVVLVCVFACLASAAAAPGVLTALELYNGNDEELKQTYAEQPIVVKGIATYVGPNRYSLPSVNLSDSADGETYVLCVLPFDDFFKLGDIAVGQEVTFSGEFRGRMKEGSFLLKKCVIVEN